MTDEELEAKIREFPLQQIVGSGYYIAEILAELLRRIQQKSRVP